jgi:hypothetical protein
MDSAQEMSNQDKELAGEVMESLGEPKEAASEINESHESVGHENTNDPLYVQKRLKQQKRAHEREMREMHARMAEMQSRMSPNQPEQSQQGGHYEAPQGGIEEQIHKAVSYALGHKEREESKAREAKNAAHVHKQYHELHKHLDKVADEIDDFDEVVRGEDAPFSAHMRDAALFLPKSGPGSAGKVLYHLGKNPDQLHRISNLHPLDQAAEMVKLSHALISGGEQKGSQPRPLGQIKSNPVVNTHAVNDKTPVSELRKRMKAGSKNWS